MVRWAAQERLLISKDLCLIYDLIKNRNKIWEILPAVYNWNNIVECIYINCYEKRYSGFNYLFFLLHVIFRFIIRSGYCHRG